MTDLWRLSAVELAGKLAAGDVSSEEATRSHLDRIAAVDGRVRAFTTVLRDEAIAGARRADEERRRGRVRGEFHGLPVTVKESLDFAGYASTLGVRSRASAIARADGGIVQALREAGAVPLGRTNVSQLLLYHESRNPLFGQTANPWSALHGPGGSSGGEAAAIAAGMSPLGIGTDIGGSIRVPAHFCGICGLKPTLDRWTNRGSNGALAGQETIRSQLGPMARTVGDLVLAMRALDPRRMSEIDGRVPPLPFVARADASALRVGVYVEDGLVPVSAAVGRAVRRAASALEGRVARVVPFVPPRIPELVYLYFAALSADGGATVDRLLAGGEIDPVLLALKRMAQMPDRVRRVFAKVMRLTGEPRGAGILQAIGRKPVEDLWRITNDIRAYRFELDAAMQDAEVDVVLCPVHATPALPHGLAKDFAIAGSHSMLWNLVQMPAGVVPVSRVEPGETRRQHPKGRLEKQAAKVDAESAGLPVGVQVVGKPWREDDVLAVMAAIEQGVAGDARRPDAPRVFEA